MGFLDKLKDAGKKAAYGALLASVHKYGTVSDGKYKGCQVATDAHGEVLLFVMVAKESGRHNISEDFASADFRRVDNSNDLYWLELTFKSEETCRITLKAENEVGTALPTAEERLAAHYDNMAKFLGYIAKKVPVTASGLDLINLVMRYACKPEIEK